MRRRRLTLLTVALAASLVIGETRDEHSLTLDHGGIVRGPTDAKRLALIFTGGDFADGVPIILRVCRERNVPASFFVTGDFLRKNADAAKAIVAAGHLLGPHSDRHLLYCDWNDREKSLVTRTQFEADLKGNLADLAAIGARPSPYFLPPFEWFNVEQVDWAKSMGLTLVNFSSGSGSNRDYIPEGEPRFASSAEIAKGILDFETREPSGLNGFLLLLHAGSKRADKMDALLDGLVAELRGRGYAFVTLDELLGPPASQPARSIAPTIVP